MDWFRSWHGAPTDSKFLLIAKRAQVAPGVVSAIYWALLDYASQNTPRGSVHGFDTETYAEWAGWEEETIVAVITAMRNKGIITEDDRIAAWEKRQPKREDDGAVDRMRRMRQRNASVTRDDAVTNATVTQRDAALRDVTQRDAVLRDVTIDKEEIREDKRREDDDAATAARTQMVRQYEAVLGMVPTASYPEMTRYMDKLIKANATDWWPMALQETTGARRPSWQYMKAVLEGWLAAGQPRPNGASSVNGASVADSRPRVPAPPASLLAQEDARQAEYERQEYERLMRAGVITA